MMVLPRRGLSWKLVHGPWMVWPGRICSPRDVAPVCRHCFSAGTPFMQIDSRKFNAEAGSLFVAEIFKMGYS